MTLQYAHLTETESARFGGGSRCFHQHICMSTKLGIQFERKGGKKTDDDDDDVGEERMKRRKEKEKREP